MQRSVSALYGITFPVLALVALGCTGSPIGDPCIPENIPPSGFDSREIYLETSSVQCRTRTCMVFQLQGNPEHVSDNGTCPEGADDCVTQGQLNAQVYCTCRCSVADGDSANTPLCNCADGFTCIEDIVTTGGPGVRGGYCTPCIRSDQPDDPRNLDPGLFDNCPMP